MNISDGMTSPNRRSGIFIRGLTPDDVDIPDSELYHYDDDPRQKRLSGILKEVPVLNLDGSTSSSHSFGEHSHLFPHGGSSRSSSPAADSHPEDSVHPVEVSIIPEDEARDMIGHTQTLPVNVPRRRTNEDNPPNGTPELIRSGSLPVLDQRADNRDSVYSMLTVDSLRTEPEVFIRGLSKEDVTHPDQRISSGDQDTDNTMQVALQRGKLEFQDTSLENVKLNSTQCRNCPCHADVCGGTKSFTCILAGLVLLSGSLHFYKVGLIVFLEREYGLSSMESGITIAGRALGQLLSFLLFVRCCLRRNIPRCIGVVAIGITLSAIVYALPYLLEISKTNNAIKYDENAGTQNVSIVLSTNGAELCAVNRDAGTVDKCDNGFTGDSFLPHAAMVTLLTLAAVCHGMAEAPVYCLGLAVILSCPRRKATPFSLYVVVGAALASPTVGVLVAMASCLQIPGSDMKQPIWWLGGVVLGAAVLPLACPLWFFRQTPSQGRENREYRCMGQSHGTSLYVPGRNVSRMGIELKALLSNWSFLLAGAAICLDLQLWLGYLPFLPTLLRTQLPDTPDTANLVMGLACGLPAVLGLIAGSSLASRLRDLASYCLALLVQGAFAAACVLTMVWMRCDNRLIIPDECAMSCGCSARNPQPVCGNDGITYYSPCMAGCDYISYSNSSYGDSHTYFMNQTVYNNCRCMADQSVASEGSCDPICYLLIPHTLLLAAVMFTSGLTLPLFWTVIQRLTSGNSIAYVIVVLNVAILLIAGIPGPIVYGFAVDSSCSEWHYCSSGELCATYDVVKMANVVYGGTFATKMMVAVAYGALFGGIVIGNKTANKSRTTSPLSAAGRS